MFERDAGAFDHAKKRIFGQSGFDSSLSINQIRQVAQLRRTTGHNNAVINDVGGQFRRSFLQNIFDRFYNLSQFCVNGFDYFVGADLRATGKP